MSDSMTTDSDASGTSPAAGGREALAALVQRTPAALQGARWFWWIAGLTLANAACIAVQARIAFSLGLGFTQLAHSAFQANAGMAYAIDAFFVVAFFMLGRQAQRGQAWAFVLGGGVYLCDALVYLTFGAPLPMVFHGVALFFIVRGYNALVGAMKAPGPR
jgi:hypothetical protein